MITQPVASRAGQTLDCICMCICKVLRCGPGEGTTTGEINMAGEVRNGCSADAIGGAVWRKSTLSGNLGNCVEVAVLGGGDVAVRNSRHPAGPALVFTPAEWAAFVGGVQRDEFAPAPIG
jgi:hypothetical protein